MVKAMKAPRSRGTADKPDGASITYAAGGATGHRQEAARHRATRCRMPPGGRPRVERTRSPSFTPRT